MEFHSLVHTDITHIHTAFIDAFSEYEVPMDLPIERLQAMMQIRSYDPALSLGCVVDAQLVGFVLVGARRDAHGHLRTYDVATGVTRAYQNRKVGAQLITRLLPALTQAGAVSFQLEVLEHNTAAQALYTKHGFATTRTLHCYHTTQIPVDTLPSLFAWGNDPAVIRYIDEARYSSFVPSWQQALASYQHTAATCRVVSAHDGATLVAYGIIEQPTASIMQIGVHPAYRDRELLVPLIARLAQGATHSHLRMLNVQADSWLDQQLQALGWQHMISQFEMVHPLTTPPSPFITTR